MTFRVKYKGLDVECDSILDLEKLTPVQQEKPAADPKQLYLPFSQQKDDLRIGGPERQPKIVKDVIQPRIQGVDPATAWRIMSKYERNCIIHLIHLRNYPVSLGVDVRTFHRISGGKGQTARGLSGFNRVVSRMCEAMHIPVDSVFTKSGYSHERRYHAGPRIDEFIRAYTGMQIQQILDIITKPDKK